MFLPAYIRSRLTKDSCNSCCLVLGPSVHKIPEFIKFINTISPYMSSTNKGSHFLAQFAKFFAQFSHPIFCPSFLPKFFSKFFSPFFAKYFCPIFLPILLPNSFAQITLTTQFTQTTLTN